ncbi:MAG: YfhO family protein [Verrucomicrobiota bacterium]
MSSSRHYVTEEWLTPWRMALLLWAGLTAAFPAVMCGTESFFFRDYGVMGYPLIHHQHESFWRGEWPLWNPLSNCGAPLLAQWGTMSLYPGSLIYLLLPLPWSLSFFCFLHLVLGGVGMFLLARRWTKHTYAAGLAGCAFVFNGVTFSCLLWPNYLVALGWMPWVVLTAEEALKTGGRRILWAGVVAALQLLAGVPELAVLTWMVVIGLATVNLINRTATIRSTVTRLAASIGLATALTAAQLLPFFELLSYSQRDPGFALEKWALPGWGWANLIVPLFHCLQSPQGIFFQTDQGFFSSCYLGILALVLAIWGGLFRRTGQARLLAVLTVLALVFAMGENGYVYGWLKHVVPSLGLARYPVKFLLLATFTVPLLAAFAIQWWTELPPEENRQAWIIAGISLVTVFLLSVFLVQFAYAHPFTFDQPDVMKANGATRRWVLVFGIAILVALRYASDPVRKFLPQFALLALLFLDVLVHVPRQNPSLPVDKFYPGMWAQAFGAPPLPFPEGRAMISPVADDTLNHSTVSDQTQNWIGKRLSLWSHLNLLEQTPKVNGSSTLQIREQKKIEDLIYKQRIPPSDGLIDFLAVRYLTKKHTVIEWTWHNDAMPLITAGQKAVFAPQEQIPNLLFATNFNPRRVVYFPESLRADIRATNEANVIIHDATLGFHQGQITVEASAPSLLVIAQSWYPCWKAYLDGKTTPLLCANYAFQAIQIPIGKHQIQLRYVDIWFHVGFAISLITLALVGVALFFQGRTRKPVANLRNQTSKPSPHDAGP